MAGGNFGYDRKVFRRTICEAISFSGVHAISAFDFSYRFLRNAAQRIRGSGFAISEICLYYFFRDCSYVACTLPRRTEVLMQAKDRRYTPRLEMRIPVQFRLTGIP